MRRATMKILILHNSYQQKGGEDVVVRHEHNLLHDAGHEVVLDQISNDDITSPFDRVRTAYAISGSQAQYQRVLQMCRTLRPDIVHIHNFFPRLTPAAHVAAARSGAAVVQSLHNYRLLCASALLMRGGKICEECLGPSRLPAIRHKCYRGSYLGSLAVNRMIGAATDNPEWIRSVDRFIALTEFGKTLFVKGGLPEENLFVKPNFLPHCPVPTVPKDARDMGYVFIGRLSQEKGIARLIAAWNKMPHHPLNIIGNGPEAEWCAAHAAPHIRLHGALPYAQTQEILGRARALLFPSKWYEGCPMILLEALAKGTPVLASNIGVAGELLPQEFATFSFNPLKGEALANAVLQFEAMDWSRLSHAARAQFDARFTAAQNLELMMHCYEAALACKQAKAAHS
ncbi:MAG: glycosyltransferase [Rhodobacteraceae bacterium]|nr:glycosyltransferase [Paracoccaceae bacterium]